MLIKTTPCNQTLNLFFSMYNAIIDTPDYVVEENSSYSYEPAENVHSENLEPYVENTSEYDDQSR